MKMVAVYFRESVVGLFPSQCLAEMFTKAQTQTHGLDPALWGMKAVEIPNVRRDLRMDAIVVDRVG